MPFNPDKAKQVQEVIFSRKTNRIIYPPLYFSNEVVKLMHAENRYEAPGDLRVELVQTQ